MIRIEEIVSKIISEQELVIGPLAWDVAGRVGGLSLVKHKVSVKGPSDRVLSSLVKAYEGLFGAASREVCRDAISSMRADIDDKTLPDELK